MFGKFSKDFNINEFKYIGSYEQLLNSTINKDALILDFLSEGEINEVEGFLASQFANSMTTKKLKFQICCVKARNIENLKKFLFANKKFTELILDKVEIENETVAKEFAEAIKYKYSYKYAFQSITFEEIKLTSVYAHFIYNLTGSLFLKRMNFSQTYIDNDKEIFEFFLKFLNLNSIMIESLEFKNSFKNPSNLLNIFEIARNTQKIKSLSLIDNALEKIDVEKIANYLKDENFKLEKLHLDFTDYYSYTRNEHSVEFISKLVKGLKTNKSLKELSLENFLIGIEGFESLKTSLKTNNTLENLSISKSTLSEEEIEILLEILEQNKNIKKLVLDDVKISNETIAKFLSGLKNNNSLESLFLNPDSFYSIYSKGDYKNSIHDLIKYNSSLRRISFGEELLKTLERDGYEDFANNLDENKSIISFNTNPWVKEINSTSYEKIENILQRNRNLMMNAREFGSLVYSIINEEDQGFRPITKKIFKEHILPFMFQEENNFREVIKSANKANSTRERIKAEKVQQVNDSMKLTNYFYS